MALIHEERRCLMKVTGLSFGSITLDGETWEKDIIIDNCKVKKRDKGVSKIYTYRFRHTPLSKDENIPWSCSRLIVGAGQSSALPIMKEVYEMAEQKGVELIVMSTPEAVRHINEPRTNFIFHLTC